MAANFDAMALVESADIDADPRHDLCDPTFREGVAEMIDKGGVHAVVAGPPCGSWSKARFNKHFPGPRPLRIRSGRYRPKWSTPGNVVKWR